MDTRIWKFELEITDHQFIDMPHGAEILSVQLQDSSLVAWALIDPDAPVVSRHFLVFGTGNSIPDSYNISECYKYIATVQSHSGRLVWHIFVDKK